MPTLVIIGGGLAGSEAAWQAAQLGIQVFLYEMRPNIFSPAHTSDSLAELVCSNSLGSNQTDRASGLLKEELRMLGSLLLSCAEQSALPAGGALAVDREYFSSLVTEKISQHPLISVVRKEITTIPEGPTIIATGPLTSDKLASSIQWLTDHQGLSFFDAIAPIVYSESINMDIAFRASRYERGQQEEGDYINCPFSKEQYLSFVDALLVAERIQLKSFELGLQNGVKAGAHQFFEGCLPVEIIAERGCRALTFGPMRPVGLFDPHTKRRPYAVVQLRQDNLAGTLFNLVGFQTNLTYAEQKRVFRLIPGLENAEFARLGQMHRNTFIASPEFLESTLQFKTRSDLFFAGQITGIEGYMGAIGTGLLAGMNAARILLGMDPVILPLTTMLGSLCHYITHASLQDFQPMKANFGILPFPDSPSKGKRQRAKFHALRSLEQMKNTCQFYCINPSAGLNFKYERD